MKTFKQKLTSRKFLAAVAGLVSGLAIVFGLDENIITQVSGAVISVASVVAYIIAEGKIDAAAVGQAAEDVAEAVDSVVKNPTIQTGTINFSDVEGIKFSDTDHVTYI